MKTKNFWERLCPRLPRYYVQIMMMVLNVVFLKLLIAAMGHMPSDIGVLPWMLLIVGIARVARKADSWPAWV